MCKKNYNREYYLKNRDKIRQYYFDNIEKFREREKNRPKRKRIEKRKNRPDFRKWRDRQDKLVEVKDMKRGYILKLMKDVGFKKCDISEEMIESYRALLLLKREIKNHDKERST